MKEWIDRYVHAVTGRLPQNQRADIERELRGLIEDMLDERAGGGEPEADRVEAVLKELGDPEEWAAKYRGRERYLIGPDVFDAYVMVLKVVGASILLGLTVAFFLQLAFNPAGIMELFANYVVNLVLGLVQGFAWVTFAFALIDHYGGLRKTGKGKTRKAWSPADLPPVPDPKLDIKASEPIAAFFSSWWA